ncbi:aminotransferase class V-fold PLP-dependent enzyme [Neisseria shayeganii]|uniref:Alanine--glyoxylate aminotransferase family protein n=1 Tax=Neisseria shayeganii TaxID=607712 RepID=A0A7D7S6A3_9NEIS|nr:aminotransferase class V-fold PLP-dependent enzyme [Neisseria shayeganii]QMT39568.1 alanine--glyoxylate aminotransferase family protein [Neisseria shayeganii]
MPALLPHPDADGLLEYSVVYTDRAVNHMSQQFQTALRELAAGLKEVYAAQAAVVVPGSGTAGMEAVARQLARGKRCLIVRNGFFSFRWTQILEKGALAAESCVLAARPTAAGKAQPFAPAPIEEVEAAIAEFRPEIVFAPHVETASGMMLPDDYLRRLSRAAHEVGALLVVDCIASGCMWLDMRDLGIDVLLSAPQKGWSSPPCAGLVMLSAEGVAAVENSESDSFDLDLKKWLNIMQAFENGGHAYHATMPTDGLIRLRDTLQEARAVGFAELKAAQAELGRQVRAMLAEKGFASVAAPGFEAPGVVVCYTDRADIQSGKAFVEQGVQIAAGVPLQCGESDFQTFRIGLFGLDKLQNIPRTVALLAEAVDKVQQGAA